MPVEGMPLSSLGRMYQTHNRQESGNMIIMALSYAQKTGDNSHLKTYVSNPIGALHADTQAPPSPLCSISGRSS